MEKRDAKEIYAKLQRDVNALLLDAEHVFDYMAEYAHDAYSEHVIDIDEILSEHARQQKVAHERRIAAQHRLLSHRHAENRGSFPKAPKKIIVAPPKKLHEEVREYNKGLATKPAERKKLSPLKFLFRRLEY